MPNARRRKKLWSIFWPSWISRKTPEFWFPPKKWSLIYFWTTALNFTGMRMFFGVFFFIKTHIFYPPIDLWKTILHSAIWVASKTKREITSEQENAKPGQVCCQMTTNTARVCLKTEVHPCSGPQWWPITTKIMASWCMQTLKQRGSWQLEILLAEAQISFRKLHEIWDCYFMKI